MYLIGLQSKALTERCEDLSGTVRVMNKEGQTLQVPGTGYYPAEYELYFTVLDGACVVGIRDDGAEKEKFIMTNMSEIALEKRLLELKEGYGISVDLSNIAVLYGGIGNQVEIEINNAKEHVPIEPVGVIVIGIDGLRQDVLYTSTEASYSDPAGCGGASCNVPVNATSLPGLSRIITDDGIVKVKDVTAIFPSITLASWASIFTGKMPEETGILGNEFFARDLSVSVPERFDKPGGIISFGSGAFRGYDDVFPLASDFFVPYQANWAESVSTEDTPQNSPEVLKAQTVYEAITTMPGVDKYFGAKGGDPAVVANSHYSRGAYWLTWDIELGCTLFWTCESKTIDQASWDKFDDYLDGRYTDLSGRRNEPPFSALTVWYLPGLDHEAHFEGMSKYRNYLMNTTDSYIGKVIDKLKELDEFDNKIFIITADHGHTEMPHPMYYKDPKDGQQREADTSCKLKLKDFDKENTQNKEKYNNNLHIWELGEMLKVLGKETGLNYKVLAPEPIAKLFKDKSGVELLYGATSDINKANIIAAMNGPMAHIYLKKNNEDWQTAPNITELGRLALVFQRIFQEDGINLDENLRIKLKNKFPRLLSSIDKILIRVNGTYKVFRGLEVTGNPITDELTTLTGNEYVKALDRIEGTNHPQRSGDIILLMRDKTPDAPGQRYSTGSACKSWHGSLNPSDSYVPLIVAYPGGNRYELESLINNTEGCNVTLGCDGNWRTTDLILEIIKRQYE